MDTDDCEDHDHSTINHQVILHSVQILWIDTKMVIVLPCTTHYVGWLLVLHIISFLSPNSEGVGVHHAGLLPCYRRLVEQLTQDVWQQIVRNFQGKKIVIGSDIE